MCLTCPKQIIKIEDKKVLLKDSHGKESEALTIKGDIKKGDWVLTQANLILEKISKKEADEINKLFQKS